MALVRPGTVTTWDGRQQMAEAHLAVLAESLALQLRLCSSQAMERRIGPVGVKPRTGQPGGTLERPRQVTVLHGRPIREARRQRRAR